LWTWSKVVRRIALAGAGCSTPPTIESLNYQLRKVTKARGHFLNDDAVVKLLWLAIINIEDKRARQRLGGSRPGCVPTIPPASSRVSESWAGARPSRARHRLSGRLC